jgi:hypothetical protein
MHENLILNVGNRNIHNFLIFSIGITFLCMIYNASDFADFELSMILEFEDSFKIFQMI